MTTRDMKLWTLASAALLLMPSAASSQTHADSSGEAASQVEITPYFGYGADMTSMMGGWTAGYPGPHAGTGPAFGGRFAYRVQPNLLVEATAGYSRPTHMFDGQGYASGHMAGYVVPGPGVVVGSAASLSYEGNLLYEFRVSRWAPYLTAGIGAFTTWPDGGSAWTDPAGNFGIGLKFYAQPRIALRLDLREYVGQFRQVGNAASGQGSNASSVGAHPQITAGIGFGF